MVTFPAAEAAALVGLVVLVPKIYILVLGAHIIFSKELHLEIYLYQQIRRYS